VQNSDSGSMTFCSKAGSSSQKTSPFHEIVSYAPEQLSSSSLGSSPDDNSSDGIKLDENEVWQFRLAYARKWQGVVFKICPYLDRYFLASAGNTVSSKSLAFFSVYSVKKDPNQKVLYLSSTFGLYSFLIGLLSCHSVLCLWFP